MDIATLDNVDADDIAKVIRHKDLYESGQIGVGGYYITFNNSIDIPAWALYGAKETLPLTLEDFKKFTQKICWIQRKYAILWNVADKIFLIWLKRSIYYRLRSQ